MKRAAESQLTKDAKQDADSDDEVTTIGLQKATPAVLASRPMKGLPKRDTTMSSASVPSTPTPTGTSRFAAFTGFGTPPVPVSSSSTSPATNGTPSSLFTLPPRKPLQSQGSMPHQPPLTPAATMIVDDSDDQDLLLKRGLNHAFIQALEKKFTQDPTTDLSSLFTHYKEKLGSLSKSNSRSSFTTSSTSPSFSLPTFSLPTQPYAPSTFKATSAPTNQAFKTGSTNAPSTSALPSFIKSTTAASSSTPISKPTASISFGTPAGSPSINIDFTGKVSAPQNEDTPQPFVFGRSKDGATSTSTPFSKPPLSFPPFHSSSLPKSADASGSSAIPQQSFAFNPTAALSSGNLDTSRDAKSPLFSFASSSTVPGIKLKAPSASSSSALSFGGSPTAFGAKASVGNPVGFSFGSPPKKDGLENESLSASESTLVPPPASTNGMSGAPTLVVRDAEQINSRDGTPLSEVSGGVDDENEIFAGEENETTLYSLRCKVSKRSKSEGKQWSTMGVGYMKLKSHNETGSKRLLHRDSNSKRIIINCSLFKGFSTIAKDKNVVLTVIEGDAPENYCLRVASDIDAKNLKSEIDKAVASLP